MASDDYRPPWLPVYPAPDSEEAADEAPQPKISPAPAAPRSESETPPDDEAPTTPPTTPPLAPARPPAAPYAPFGNPSPATPESGSSPSPGAAAAFFGASREHAAASRQTGEGQEASQAPGAPISPYLNGGRAPIDASTDQSESRSSAQESWAGATPPPPPVSGAVPSVRPDDLTPSKPLMPHSMHPAAPSPAPEPEQDDKADDIPTPIEDDEADIIAPITPPSDSEIMPFAGEESEGADAPSPRMTPWSPSRSREQSDQTESSPASADSVRQLGAAAISNASLQAAGAPTPKAGIPRVDEQEDAFPTFGEEKPFVPRYEPSGRTIRPQTPSVSFTEPMSRPSSPLSDVDVPEADDPAYTPRVEPRPRLTEEPAPKQVTPAADMPAPSESAVEDDDAEVATPTELAEETPPEPDERVADEPAEKIADEPQERVADEPKIVWFEPANPRLPMPPLRSKKDSPMEERPETDAPDSDSDLSAGADLDASDTNDEVDAKDDHKATAGEQEVAAAAPRKGKRWIWWLIAGLVVASAAGVLVYRLFLLPEPITLPVPTVTATPAGPVGVPIAIEDPSDFVAALPATVQTYVLDGYESIDPLTESDLPARVAEHDMLTYGEGAASAEFVVDAYQHYNVEDAQTTYDTWTADTTEVEPVLVDGEQVGERALMTQGTVGTVVWRNVTAVFVLTGPADSVLDFYEHYGV